VSEPPAARSEVLRILCLEDSLGDAELMEALLEEAGLRVEMDVVDTRSEFARELDREHHDVVLADYTLPGFDAPAALEILREKGNDVPFICVSGTIGEDKAVQIVKDGAADYLLKDRMARLPIAVRQALEGAESRRARRRAEEESRGKTVDLRRQAEFLATLLDTIPSPVFYKDTEGVYLGCNRAFEELLGKSREEIVGTVVQSTGPEEITSEYADKDDELLANPGRQTYEWRVEAADGELRDVVFNKATFAGPEGEVGGIIGVLLDITRHKAVERALEESSIRLRAALHETVRAMGAVVELRDPYTSGHERRVTELGDAIAGEMGLDEDVRDTIRLAGEVHDVGKIGVPAEILSKPGTLTEVERNLINLHPTLGRDILGDIAFEGPVAEVVFQHHERLDGSGYPRGLTGDEVLVEARVLAVADVVEAMASHRPYREALGIDAALAEVRAGAGSRYDAGVVAACERVFAAGFRFAAGASADALFGWEGPGGGSG